MQIFNGTDNLPGFENPVVAVGAFDGVHLGHVRILRFLREQAERVGGTSVVLTFDPHPRTVLHPASEFFTINTLEDNLHLIEKQGIALTVSQSCWRMWSRMTAEWTPAECHISSGMSTTWRLWLRQYSLILS